MRRGAVLVHPIRRGAVFVHLNHTVEQMQHMPPPAARGNHRIGGAVGIHHGADAIAEAREQARDHGDEFRGQRSLCDRLRAEVHRTGEIEQEPGGDLAVFLEFANMRRLQSRGDVPVYVANVIVRLVFAQVGEIEADAAEQRAVVALQQSVEATDHSPFEPTQDLLGIGTARRLDNRGLGRTRRPASATERVAGKFARQRAKALTGPGKHRAHVGKRRGERRNQDCGTWRCVASGLSGAGIALRMLMMMLSAV